MSEEVPKICGHEMVRINSRRFEWGVARAVRVELWKPWWTDFWRCRIWLYGELSDEQFEQCVKMEHLAFQAEGAALVVSHWLRKTSESLVFALSRPIEER